MIDRLVSGVVGRSGGEEFVHEYPEPGENTHE
jgi:hypothetical protein